MFDLERRKANLERMKANIVELNKKNKIKYNIPEPTPDQKSSVTATIDDIINPKLVDLTKYREMTDDDLKLH